ncbi:MAG: polysaccharide pyruvyl transferase family protein [Butyrivibrio sp.]
MVDTYDIGIVCMMNYNIGNNLTNYALYSYLRDKGYKVAMIDMPYGLPVSKQYEGRGPLFCFLKSPYRDKDIIKAEDKWELYNKSDMCNAYMVASDQLWRDYFVRDTDYYFMLDWVPSYKYKFSYGTSIGTDIYDAEEKEIFHAGYLMGRFNKISVREQSAQKLIMDKWGMDSVLVLDPVFMCNRIHYDELASYGGERTPKGRYTAMYFLDASEQKETIGKSVAEHLTNGMYMSTTEIIYTEAQSDIIDYTIQPHVEEWLAMIKNSDFVITDSFHGMCFAIIYQKPFYVVFNKDSIRGYARFVDLLSILGLEDRLISDVSTFNVNEAELYSIDYDKVNEILDEMKNRSRKWFDNTLNDMKSYHGKDDAYGCYLHTEYQRVLNEKKYRKLFAAQSEKLREVSLSQDKNSLKTIVVGWGTGNCFKENVNRVLSYCDMKYVCDNNSEMWGSEVAPGVVCISPVELFKMDDVFVVIMVERLSTIKEIESELDNMGIKKHECVKSWLEKKKY